MVTVPNPSVDLIKSPTETYRLDRLSDDYSGELYVKRDDNTAGVTQGNKIRKLEYLLGDALEQGADVVVTAGGLQSNHCRATAVVARQLGLDVYLLLHGEEPEVYDGNHLLDKLVGAEIEYVSEEIGPKRRPSKFETVERRLEEAGRTPYSIPVGGSNPIGVLGYVRAFEEIGEYMRETGTEFDNVYVATGSGGTQAGLIAGAMYDDWETTIVGIKVTEFSEAELEERIVDNVVDLADHVDGAELDPQAVRDRVVFDSEYMGPGYAQPAAEDLETIVEAGRREGLILDTSYTGKAFRAFLEGSEAGERNLFVHTGGSYGAFPYRQQLSETIDRASG